MLLVSELEKEKIPAFSKLDCILEKDLLTE